MLWPGTTAIASRRRQSARGRTTLSHHPLNLALRFALEVAASIAIGYWGWHQAEGPLRYAPAILLPLAAGTLWSIFRVPGDATASGDAPVTVPGPVRLALELGLFTFAAWGLANMGRPVIALFLTGTTLLHYVVSYKRILWLLREL